MKRLILIFGMLLLGLWSRDASAFWGRMDRETASGLNVEAGFDVNTITTLNGVVLSPPEVTGPRKHMVMSMTTTQGTVTVIIGPSWYWERQNIIIAKDQDLTVIGSLAQGKDGSFYLFAQRIENRSDGKTVVLRSETGIPLWSRAGSGNQRGNGRQSGDCPPSGPGGRGGMRGGRQ